MKFDIMTLFPAMVEAVLGESIIGRARKADAVAVECHQIRDYTKNKHRNVDDTPAGGGMGMVMSAQPIYDCYQAILASRPEGEKRHTIYLSPRGRHFTQEVAKELSQYDHIVLLCGHYEGVDQRVIDAIADEELSIGDYVLTGGEIPACIVVDATARLLPGVLADPACYEGESIASGLLEYPQYTKPAVWEGRAIPEVLLSGDHKRVDEWRLAESLALTKERRPDLYEAYMAAHPPKPPKQKRRRKSAPPTAETQE
jgi:tRNA (guanine37-N1)-methyltransferase